MSKDEIDEEDIFNELIALAEDGKVLGACPKCSLPLGFLEILIAKCNTCGEIKKEEILWRKVDEIMN